MEANNMKAMREALVGLAQAVQDFLATKGRNFYPDMAVALEAAAAALAAPPRNCDLYNSGDADKDANSAWDCFNGALNLDIQNLSERELAMLKEFMSAFVWLFSSAKEVANDEQK